MITKTIEYVNYFGEKKKKEYVFGLNPAEISEWLMQDGDYTVDKVMEKIAKERNGRQLMNTFKDLIKRSYGVISVDGDRFIKNEEVKTAFMESEAYSVLFMELISNATKAAEFFVGVMPADMSDDLLKAFNENPDAIPEDMRPAIEEVIKAADTK